MQRLLADCPEADRQAVVDEVAAIASRGAVKRSVLALLGALVRRANEGTFVPVYGMAYAASIRHRPLSAGPPTTLPEPISDVGTRALTTIRVNLERLRAANERASWERPSEDKE
ncbi:MAG: hypothetical protein ABI859_04530 [Pseudomonadota bacterium]